MIKASIIAGLAGLTAYAVYRLYKEIKFLHKVASETMFVNTKMNILYLHVTDKLLDPTLDDEARRKAIFISLKNGWRPAAC